MQARVGQLVDHSYNPANHVREAIGPYILSTPISTQRAIQSATAKSRVPGALCSWLWQTVNMVIIRSEGATYGTT